MTSALIQVSSNGVSQVALAAGQSTLLQGGTLLAITPQSLTGVTSVAYAFSAPGTTLDGVTLSSSAAPFAGEVWLPQLAFAIALTTTVNGSFVSTNTLNVVLQAQGTGGGAGAATVSFASLATTAPTSTKTSVFSDGYRLTGDGGGGTFAWTSVSPGTPDGGNVSTALGGGWWVRTVQAITQINVKHYGATGNGVTDDTAAINAAIAAFELAQQLAYQGSTAGSSVLYFPPGVYFVTSPLVINACSGGVITGAGKQTTKILGETFAFRGAKALLLLQDCQHVTVRDIHLTPPSIHTTFTGSGMAQGTKIFTVATVTGLTVGQRLGLKNAAGQAEVGSIAIIAGSTVTLAKATLYAYAFGDTVMNACVFAACSYKSGALVPFTVTANNFQDCGADPSGNADEFIFAFGADCLGGGPVNITGTTNSGQPTVLVDDVSQVQPGMVYSLWHNVAASGAGDGSLTVQSVNYAASSVTFTTNLTSSYAANGYMVSAVDADNELHTFENCATGFAVVAAFGFFGWNSIDNKIINPNVETTYAAVSVRQGGTFTWVAGFAGSQGVDFELGGGMQSAIKVIGFGSEGVSQALVVHSVDNAQSLRFDGVAMIKKGGPPGVSQKLIDVNGSNLASGFTINFSHCSLASGANSNQLVMNFNDASSNGHVSFSGGCRFGCFGYTLVGTNLTDVGTVWESMVAPSGETATAALVTATNVTYGSGAGQSTRAPVLPLVATATNNNTGTYGSSVIEFTDAGSAMTFSGFSGGFQGMEFETVFLGGATPHQVTLVNNATSTVGNRLFTGTNANVVFTSSVSGFVSIRWRYSLLADGTNPGWRLIARTPGSD